MAPGSPSTGKRHAVNSKEYVDELELTLDVGIDIGDYDTARLQIHLYSSDSFKGFGLTGVAAELILAQRFGHVRLGRSLL